MHTLALAAALIAPAQPPAKHEDANPLYKSLTGTGLAVGGNSHKFPAPTMPDGLTAEQQTAAIKKLIDGDYEFENFTRNSVVGPNVTKIRDLVVGDKKTSARAVDVWFVLHGDFKKLDDDKFLDKVVGNNKGAGGKGGELKAADLMKRKIAVPDGKNEGYGFVEFDFLDKVRLKATGHAYWSRGAESVVAAAEIDPRFANDTEFPNEWRALTNDGGVKVGNPNVWAGAGMYLKITKLKEPAGALFVEQHVIFDEPPGWFGGENLLRSKLPIAVQKSVRDMRGEFAKAK
jgi:hypothetical protein